MKKRCTVCGSQATAFDSIDEANLYRCPSCEHCFTDVDSVVTHERYDPAYFEQDHRNWFENPNVPLFSRLAAIINEAAPAGSVIDVGCGNGDFLRYLRRANPRLALTGIDFNTSQRADGIHLVSGDILTSQLGHKYDVIVSLAVIEHVLDLGQFMGRVVELSHPGSLVIIMTVNDQGLLYGLARLLNNLGYTTPYRRLYSKHHINHFNVRSLRRCAEQSGLRVIRTLRHNTLINAVAVPSPSRLVEWILKAAIAGVFWASSPFGKTYLQTIVCERDPREGSAVGSV